MRGVERGQLRGLLQFPDFTLARIGLACWIASCGEGAPEEPEPAPVHAPALAPPWQAPPNRAGSQLCEDCHEDVVESWSHTGMARALGPIDPGEFAGLEQVPDTPAGLAYAYVADARGVRLLETSAHRPQHALAAEIIYAIGAGVKDRAFVARLGAFEWFAPLEVVSAAEGRHAALAPGHMAFPGTRFENSITAECLGCHTDQLPRPAFPLNLHQAESFEPRGISCAACHGPVERHASWRTADLTGASPAGDDPIVRPRDLGREQRMSICSACHLEGDVRIAFDSRLGIPPPGRDLLDQRAVFVAAEVSQAIGFVSHTERLVLSPCYLESDMTCGSCHDPHRSPGGDNRERQRVRACRCGPRVRACVTDPAAVATYLMKFTDDAYTKDFHDAKADPEPGFHSHLPGSPGPGLQWRGRRR